MTDYRYVMGLLVQGLACRQIEAMAGCSHRAIARARRVLDDERLTTADQVEALTVEELDQLFADGRKGVVSEGVCAGRYRQGRRGAAGTQEAAAEGVVDEVSAIGFPPRCSVLGV